MTPVRRLVDEVAFLVAGLRSGLFGLMAPHHLLLALERFRRYGAVGGLFALGALRFGDRVAVLDERGEITYRELDQRSNALARAWHEAGLRPGDGVALLVRNHRGFLEALAAAAKCGTRIVLLNTDFSGPQLRDVADREGIDLLVHDEEFSPLLEDYEPRLGRYLAWADDGRADTLDEAIAGQPTTPPPVRGTRTRLILLTSGTTGTPKGAPRKEPFSMAPAGVILERVPFRMGEVREIAAPLFHVLGFAHCLFAVAMGSTIVLRRRFDAEALAESLERNQVNALIAVPVMLQRLLDAENLDSADTEQLRVVFVAGSQLGSDLATRLLDRLGPVVHNVYGSTEVAYATIAGPEDLRAAPGSVGRPLRGVTIRLYDDERSPVPAGATGRIFVGNVMQFEGYTGGGTKDIIDGLMSTGDIGHLDEDGRLHIDGRDDDMIVSGGENVFPAEVEDLLASHPEVEEVAVIGVPDEQYGQRLAAFVVPRPGAALTEQGVVDHVRSNLARFKVPRDVHFLDRLPRNPAGKVIKRSLAADDATS